MRISELFNFLEKLNPVSYLLKGLLQPDFNFKGFFYDKEFIEYSRPPGNNGTYFSGRVQ